MKHTVSYYEFRFDIMKVIEEINATTGQVQIIEDFQGPIGAQYLVKVAGDGWQIQRWFFFDEFDKKEAKMFGVKSLNNPNFRQECISGAATWAQIQKLYIEAEQTIVSIFEDYSVFEYAPSDFEGEK